MKDCARPLNRVGRYDHIHRHNDTIGVDMPSISLGVLNTCLEINEHYGNCFMAILSLQFYNVMNYAIFQVSLDLTKNYFIYKCFVNRIFLYPSTYQYCPIKSTCHYKQLYHITHPSCGVFLSTLKNSDTSIHLKFCVDEEVFVFVLMLTFYLKFLPWNKG